MRLFTSESAAKLQKIPAATRKSKLKTLVEAILEAFLAKESNA